MQVADGRVVTLEYTVRLASGAVVDSTERCGPVAIVCGSGQLFPVLEGCLHGMRPGETREVRIPPEDAYGPWRPELVRALPRARLPPGLALSVGTEYRLTAPGGKTLRFRLLEIGEREVRADFNRRAAGQELHATVTVVSVREPTAAESRRGRV